MSSSILLALLVFCAGLFFLGGILVILSGVALFFVMGRGGDEPLPEVIAAPPPRPSPPRPAPAAAERKAPAPAPMPADPPAPATKPQTLEPMRAPAPKPKRPKPPDEGEDDGGKTEVFTRGSLDLDWDDEHVEGDATEIFRSDVHGNEADPEFKID